MNIYNSIIKIANEAMSDENKKAALRIFVKKDIREVIHENEPMLTEIPEGHRIHKNRDAATGDEFLAFRYSEKDSRSNEERVNFIANLLANNLNLRKLNNPYPRKATEYKTIKQGAAVINTPVWCIDLQQDLNKGYSGIDDLIGYGFEVQLSASKTTLSIAIKYF